MEFVDAVHEQLTQRDKLTAVLCHLENATSEDAARVSAMTTWVRQRLKQIDALIGPHFLDISARSSKVDFAEPGPEQEADGAAITILPPSPSNSGLLTTQRGWPPRTRRWSGQTPWPCRLREPKGDRALRLADTKPRFQPSESEDLYQGKGCGFARFANRYDAKRDIFKLVHGLKMS